MDLNFIKTIMFGKGPPLTNTVTDRFEYLPPEGLTMGTLYIGRQGTGKTSSLARHIVDYFMAYPDRAIFVLDWSGSISENILSINLRQEKYVREKFVVTNNGDSCVGSPIL